MLNIIVYVDIIDKCAYPYLAKHVSPVTQFIYQKYPSICLFAMVISLTDSNEQYIWAQMPLPAELSPVSRAPGFGIILLTNLFFLLLTFKKI